MISSQLGSCFSRSWVAGTTVSDDDSDVRHAWPVSVSLIKHVGIQILERVTGVGTSGLELNVADGISQGGLVIKGVEVELVVRTACKLLNSNPDLVLANVKVLDKLVHEVEQKLEGT